MEEKIQLDYLLNKTQIFNLLNGWFYISNSLCLFMAKEWILNSANMRWGLNRKKQVAAGGFGPLTSN